MSSDKVLAASLWRNLFLRNCDDPERLANMVEYVRQQVSAIWPLPGKACPVLLRSVISWRWVSSTINVAWIVSKSPLENKEWQICDRFLPPTCPPPITTTNWDHCIEVCNLTTCRIEDWNSTRDMYDCGNNGQGCESSDFNQISYLFCSSQNPTFRLLMHWKAHLFRHFRLFQTFQTSAKLGEAHFRIAWWEKVDISRSSILHFV